MATLTYYGEIVSTLNDGIQISLHKTDISVFLGDEHVTSTEELDFGENFQAISAKLEGGADLCAPGGERCIVSVAQAGVPLQRSGNR